MCWNVFHNFMFKLVIQLPILKYAELNMSDTEIRINILEPGGKSTSFQ